MCNDLAVWPAVICFILAVVGLLLLHRYSMRLEKPHRESLMTLTISAGLAVVATQTLSAFTRIELEWIEPLRALRLFFSLLAFDIGFLRPQCWVGSVDPVLEYIMAICAYPFGAGCLFLIFGFYHFLLGKHVSRHQVFNAQGLVVSAFYIALTYVALLPFQCLRNPDGSAALVSYRSVICWKDDAHVAMVVLSAMPFFGIVVAYLAVVAWAVWTHLAWNPSGPSEPNIVFSVFTASSIAPFSLRSGCETVLAGVPGCEPSSACALQRALLRYSGIHQFAELRVV